MPANVALKWTRPVKRADGTPIGSAEIAGYGIDLSADLGANFVPVGVTTSPDTAFTQTELESGAYLFRVVAIDTHNPAVRGLPQTVSITVL